MGRVLTVLCLLVAITSSWATAGEQVSTLADQVGVKVTIYNQNLALVKDTRLTTLPEGMSSLAFREVSGRLRPETALLRSVSHSGALSVLEQNFDFDLLTPQKLLEKYVGQQVGVIKTHPTTGEETFEKARVLSANNGVVLRIGNRIETGVPGRLVFSDVPENLRDRPTLAMSLVSSTSEPQTMELSYLTGGLGWKADYVAELNSADTWLDINGWVTLTNTSGTTYKNAGLQLMAGDVNQVQPEIRRRQFKGSDAMMLAAEAPAMAEESLLDYHLYTLARPTTIRENQSKQVALLQASRVTCAKEYLLQGADYYYRGRHGELDNERKVGVYILLANSKANNLGMPLPKGVVRVYKKDQQDNVQFVGEDRIEHTPEDKDIRLRLGNAFDVTAVRKQTDFKKLSGFSQYNYVFESAFEIELRNARDEEVTVRIVEPLPGDWEMVSESQPHTKETAASAAWLAKVPAKGSTVLTYRVKVKY